MKKEQVGAVCFYGASALFYIAAILGFIGGRNSQANLWLCLGACFSCLAAVLVKKGQKK